MKSDNRGHVNNPNNMPNGYADVKDPKDAPVGSEKCFPSVGVRGDVMVNPSRLSVVAVRIDNMDIVILRSIFLLGDDFDDDDDDDGCCSCVLSEC